MDTPTIDTPDRANRLAELRDFVNAMDVERKALRIELKSLKDQRSKANAAAYTARRKNSKDADDLAVKAADIRAAIPAIRGRISHLNKQIWAVTNEISNLERTGKPVDIAGYPRKSGSLTLTAASSS